MEEDPIARLKAKYAAIPPLFPQSDYLNIEENKSVTFFVLCDEYSSKGIWVHPIGIHFLNKKQIVCSEIAEAGPCVICEKIRAMEKQSVPESKIFRIRGPRKYAMNVLVRGEQSPRVFLAPATVTWKIVQEWAKMIAENINIFDPLASTAFTVKTQYTVDVALEPAPIFNGDNAEERIAKILKSAANLDNRFRLSTREEQETAWRNR